MLENNLGEKTRLSSDDLYAYVGNDPLDRVDPSGNEGVLSSIADFIDTVDREIFTPLGPTSPAGELSFELPRAARSPLGQLQIVKLDAIPLRSQCDHASSMGRIFDGGDLPSIE